MKPTTNTIIYITTGVRHNMWGYDLLGGGLDAFFKKFIYISTRMEFVPRQKLLIYF